MLTNDLVVTDNSTCTKPGAAGALTFALRGTDLTGSTRSVAATSTTTPQVVTISHSLAGTGFKSRVRSLLKSSYTALNTDLADTGGVTPSATVHVVIDRPVNSGGVITATIVKNLIGQLIDILTVSGQLDKILNQEI